MWCFFTFFCLLLIVRIYGEAEDPVYDGPVVCQGTKPLLFHEKYDEYFPPDNPTEQLKKYKQFFEAYWDQFVNHVTPCQIIVGNLIIPHQHYIRFEEDRLNEALKELEIVTGYIYIYDVNIDIRFAKLKAVYGNELFMYPKEWSGYGEGNADAYNYGYAIFVEKFNGEKLYMPELRYIEKGLIGFKDTPKACVWNPEKPSLFFDQYFDVRPDTPSSKLIHVLDRSFTQCEGFNHVCEAGCSKCFSNEPGYCQKTTKKECTECAADGSKFCDTRNPSQTICCPKECHGGCDGVNGCFACKPGYFLQVTRDIYVKKCVRKCYGKTIDVADICIDDADACPDYMFSFKKGSTRCAYQCPIGMEYDPIKHFANELNDNSRIDPMFTKYYPGSQCQPCRMIYDSKEKDFKHDCGIACVIQSNSISFFTVLNIYPAITDIKDYDFSTFQQYFKDSNFSNTILKKKCRHIYGLLHLDQYSVGYPYEGARLIPEHLKILTYVTGLYGSIRIENTDSYWFADSLRNLLVIQAPRIGRLDQDFQEDSVRVRFNSDLRSIDLQRLRVSTSNIAVQYNPLYLPPVPFDDLNDTKRVFANVQYINGNETIKFNSAVKTRVGNHLTYDTGCHSNSISYFYRRCVRCASDEIRYFTSDINGTEYYELFAECEKKDKCDTKNGSYIVQRDGEEQCLPCSDQCYKCTDSTPFTCYNGEDTTKLECRGMILEGINIKACSAISDESACSDGFTEENGKCVRCDSACRQCHNNAKDDNGTLIYTVPGTAMKSKGCKGCGFVFLAKQKNGNYIAVCNNLGAAPRHSPDKFIHYLSNNPVRNLYWHIKPSKLSKPLKHRDYLFLDYGEESFNQK